MRLFTILLLTFFSTFAVAQEVALRSNSGEATRKDSTLAGQVNEVPVRKKDYSNAFQRGTADADVYYQGYKGAGTGTLVVSLISPLAGLIPAIACSSTPPQGRNLGYPNGEMYSDADYKRAYDQRAKKIKSKHVWTNWGIAFGVNLLFALAIAAK